MALEPRYGTAVAHPGLVVFAPQFGAGFAPCLLMFGSMDNAGGGKVGDGTFGIIQHIGGHLLGHAARYEAAAPHLAPNQPIALELFIRVGNRLHAYADAAADLALRRTDRKRT